MAPSQVLSEARQHFPAELLSRVDEIVLFRPLSKAAAREIAQIKLDDIVRRRFATQQMEVTYTDAVLDYVVERGFSLDLGARNIQHTIEEEILSPLARLSASPRPGGRSAGSK